MKVLIQRVKEAQVSVDNNSVGAIGPGLLLLVGIEKHDTEQSIQKLAERVLNYRIFADIDGKMNLNVQEVGGGILSISQFTLAADTHKGLRPGFSKAASPDQAKHLYQCFNLALSALHGPIAEGIFAADMQVQLINDGPVTFMLEV